MSSSKPTGPRQVPPPPNSRAGNSYTRFIPREELQGFASWTPTTFGEGVAIEREGELVSDDLKKLQEERDREARRVAAEQLEMMKRGTEELAGPP